MTQRRQRPLLDERGMHLTTIRGANQMRGTCPVCGKPDKPLHRSLQGRYWCADCVRKEKKKRSKQKE